jgi:predicted nucleotidyltransferase
MQAREGDLIKTISNVVFDVKGLVHPKDKVVAFPRFIPLAQGTRKSNDNKAYGKVYNLAERFKFLQENLSHMIVFDPVFGETLCEVPNNEITLHYKPAEKLASLRTSKGLSSLEIKALMLAEDLKKTANIPWSAIGISGSILASLYTAKSDIDPIVYGVENCRKAYAALQSMLKDPDSRFKPYTQEELKALFEFRSKDTQMGFEDFELVENRKAFQGKFTGVDYFVRFVKDWNEINEHYGDVCYKNSGYAKVQATIIDSSDSLFTPCTYRIGNLKILEGPKLEPIKEIVSFRGRFCEQAKAGEEITAQGKVELVSDKRSACEYYRLILGNKPEDYLVLSR